MPANGKLKALEVELGESLNTLIPRTIEEEGSVLRAAMRLGVVPTTLHYWLNANGFHVETQTVVVRGTVDVE